MRVVCNALDEYTLTCYSVVRPGSLFSEVQAVIDLLEDV